MQAAATATECSVSDDAERAVPVTSVAATATSLGSTRAMKKMIVYRLSH